MKHSARIVTLTTLTLSFVLFLVIGAFVYSSSPVPARAASTRSFTFVNNTSQTIWAGALGNSGQIAPANAG